MDAYRHVFDILRRYWESYGGWSAFIKSPYLHAALTVNILMYQSWMTPGWWEGAVSVLASLIGFTLGGYAILIAFGDEEFKSLLTGGSDGSGHSPFVVISATFAHFILVQIVAILAALIASSRPLAPIAAFVGSGPCMGWVAYVALVVMYGGWFMGHALFVYALFLAISATLGIFRVSTWYDRAKTKARDARNGSQAEENSQPK